MSSELRCVCCDTPYRDDVGGSELCRSCTVDAKIQVKFDALQAKLAAAEEKASVYYMRLSEIAKYNQELVPKLAAAEASNDRLRTSIADLKTRKDMPASERKRAQDQHEATRERADALAALVRSLFRVYAVSDTYIEEARRILGNDLLDSAGDPS